MHRKVQQPSFLLYMLKNLFSPFVNDTANLRDFKFKLPAEIVYACTVDQTAVHDTPIAVGVKRQNNPFVDCFDKL